MVNRGNILLKVLHYALLGSLAMVMVLPLLWMFRVAFIPAGGSIAIVEILSSSWTYNNFVDIFSQGGLGRPLINSFFVGIIVIIGNILFCFMTAYAFARYKTITSKLLFGSVIFVLMIPAHIIIIPLYILCLKTGIYDSYLALILPWLVNPIGIFLVKQYIESIPPSMEEAARVDGAGEMTIIFKIVMPLCKPALAVLAIQVFFTNWNSFLFPFILTSSESLRTLPVALALYQGHQGIDWQHLMAGSVVAVLPVLVVFLIMQRQIVSGITSGAVKQ